MMSSIFRSVVFPFFHFCFVAEEMLEFRLELPNQISACSHLDIHLQPRPPLSLQIRNTSERVNRIFLIWLLFRVQQGPLTLEASHSKTQPGRKLATPSIAAEIWAIGPSYGLPSAALLVFLSSAQHLPSQCPPERKVCLRFPARGLRGEPKHLAAE